MSMYFAGSADANPGAATAVAEGTPLLPIRRGDVRGWLAVDNSARHVKRVAGHVGSVELWSE
jgi:hypothetical protein